MDELFWVCIREDSSGELVECFAMLDSASAENAARAVNVDEWEFPVAVEVVVMERGQFPR